MNDGLAGRTPREAVGKEVMPMSIPMEHDNLKFEAVDNLGKENRM